MYPFFCLVRRARLVVFCLAALADISLLHDYVCTYNTAGPRARAASNIYFLFFLFSGCCHEALCPFCGGQLVCREVKHVRCERVSTRSFSLLPSSHTARRCCRNQLWFVTVTTVYHRLTWLIKPLLFLLFSITEKYKSFQEIRNCIDCERKKWPYKVDRIIMSAIGVCVE